MGADFVLHPLIYSFSSRKETTICGCGPERAKVWIKVCDMKFPIGLMGLHILSLKLESADTKPSK